jgi:hypothetical protein
MGSLVPAYESHGGRLAWHNAVRAADELGIDSASVHRRLARHFDRLERTGWRLAAAVKADAVRLIEDAPKALAEYERLSAADLAPPMFRMFRRVLIDPAWFPSSEHSRSAIASCGS